MGMNRNIYKEVPEQFHNQFMDTLGQLEREGDCVGQKSSRRYSPKGRLLLVAAMAAVLSTVTVGAAELFKWRQEVRERLGVEEDLADKLTMEGAAKGENAAAAAAGVTVEALQSVRTANEYYVLLAVTTPKGMAVDGDTLFEDLSVVGPVEFDGCTVNYTGQTVGLAEGREPAAATAGTQSLWEVRLRTREDVDYGGQEVTLQLKNLVQTQKTEITDLLAEGVWELEMILPSEADQAVLAGERELTLGHHTVTITRIEVDPFYLRLYGEQEELQHALRHQNGQIVGVRCHDGTVVEEAAALNITALHKDGAVGEAYIGIPLEKAIDVSRFAEVILAEERDRSEGAVDVEQAGLAAMEVLCERQGHALVWDGQCIYLWDMLCGEAERLVDLEALGFSQSAGGTVHVGPGGNILQILPRSDSEKQYVVQVYYGAQGENVYEVATE